MRIILGGDVMLGRLVDERHIEGGPAPLDGLLPLFRTADFVAVNLECAISARNSWYAGPAKAFYFRARPWAAACLEAAGVKLASLANNHALDADVAGLLETIAELAAHHVATVGAGRNLAEASRPAVVRCGDRRLAFLAACDHQPDFAATPDRPGIYYLDLADPDAALARLAEHIRAAGAVADTVIVSLHWQPNWAPVVEPVYRALGRGCIEAGASVVWGHSPHHFQGVELYRGGAILYATGDLVDDYAVHPEFRNDLQALFTVVLDDAGRVSAVEALPVEIVQGSSRPAEGDAARWVAHAFQAACASLGAIVVQEGDRLVVVP